MVKTGFIICLILLISFSAPASAQLLGDANCNGWAWEMADVVFVAMFMIEICDMYPPPCPENSDLDGDGRALTIGDLIYYMHFNNPPDYSRHPQSDTLGVGSTITNPGENIILPVTISSIDTIMGFQFLLAVDPEYLEFDSLIADDNFHMSYCNFNGDIYCRTSYDGPNSPIITDPGNYHICDLILTVNPDINQPVTTPLLFSSIPPRGLFSGLANTDFFLPVFVDAEIEILPLTDTEWPDAAIPTDFSITAYPNPFNDAVNISVFSDRVTKITVYDIIGRPVKSFEVYAGNNLINWDASDNNRLSISTGIYFIGDSEIHSFKKVLYLK